MLMKRIFAIFILLSVILSSTACSLFTPWESGKLRDTFFDEAYLAERGITDMPLPRLNGSYLDADEGILYLNLTREEYEDYAKAITAYLSEKEEIKVSGYHCENGIFGLLIFPLPQYKFAPLDDEYIDYTSDSHLFIYSDKSVELGYAEVELTDEKYISLKWNPTELDFSDASYTAVLEFPDTMLSLYLPCYHGHSYLSDTYPVPGTDKTVTIDFCSNCGDKEQSEYIGSGDVTQYKIKVVAGAEYVIDCYEHSYSGLLRELKTHVIMDADIRVTINGTEIPKTHYDSDYWGYSFIMPQSDIEITIEVIGGI